jgi:cold shock CspA family protein
VDIIYFWLEYGPATFQPRRRRQHKVTRHEIEIPDAAVQRSGIVVSRREKFGFIKSDDRRYFFHERDSDGNAPYGSKVTFIVAKDLTTGKEVAYDVKTVRLTSHPGNGDDTGGNTDTVSLKNRVNVSKTNESSSDGPYKGKIIIVAVSNGGRDDYGAVRFKDEFGVLHQALYIAPDSTVPLQTGDTVEFKLSIDPESKLYRAVEITRWAGKNKKGKGDTDTHATHASSSSITSSDTGALCDGEDNQLVQTPSSRQLGRVALLKKEFGFIRQVARPGDLFFHFSQLEKDGGLTASDIKVGDDVEYEVTRDKNGKLSAQCICRAPPGKVVFDVVSDTIYQGVVLEKPVVTKQYVQTSGVLEYASASDPERIVFAAKDCMDGCASSLRPGDVVKFRIATNVASAAAVSKAAFPPNVAKLAGSRAIEVSPVKQSGSVAALNEERKFGFILSSKDFILDTGLSSLLQESRKEGGARTHQNRRFYFHLSEVLGDRQAPLHVGDQVEYCVHKNLKIGELIAVRVKVLVSKHSEVTSVTATRQPRLTGNVNSGELKAQYTPKMPDGTRGFAYSRAKGLAAAAASAQSNGSGGSYSLHFAGLPLTGLSSAFARSLSVEAQPFVPSSTKDAAPSGN